MGIFLSWFRVFSTYCFCDPHPLFFFSRFKDRAVSPTCSYFLLALSGVRRGPEQVFKPPPTHTPGLSLGPGQLPSLPSHRLLGFSSFFLPLNAFVKLCPLCICGLYHFAQAFVWHNFLCQNFL